MQRTTSQLADHLVSKLPDGGPGQTVQASAANLKCALAETATMRASYAATGAAMTCTAMSRRHDCGDSYRANAERRAEMNWGAPWTVEPSTPQCGFEGFYLRSASGGHITYLDGPQNDLQAAKARLLAAAPEMLEALQKIMRLVDGGAQHSLGVADGNAANLARKAIAKATGGER